MRPHRWARGFGALFAASFMLVACSSSPSHPAGWKAVDYFGVRVYVPSSWPVRSETGYGVGCRTWPQSTVLLDQTPQPQSGNVTCALDASQPAAGTVVTLGRVTPADGVQAWANGRATSQMISGASATIHGLVGFYAPGIRSSATRFGSIFIIYDSGVVISASATDIHLAQQIVETARSSPH